MSIRAVSICAVLAFAGSVTWAQPNVRDKRERRKRDPDVRDKRDRRGPKGAPAIRPSGPLVRGFAPQKGAPGTDVTIRGNEFPPGVMVQLGGQRIKPTSSTPRAITFKVPPAVRPGTRRVTLTWRGGRRGVGRFEVLDRGHGGPGNVHDKRPGDYDRPDRPDTRRGPDGRRDRRRRFHRDRPLVTGFFPRKGKPGTRVTIRGRNFDKDATVTLGRRPVKARVDDRRIVFKVPPGGNGDLIRVTSGRRTIPVGRFETVEGYDYAAEHRRRERERRERAEAAWKSRQAKLAKDRKARYRAWEARRAELQRTRAERRRERLAKIRERWQRAFLRDPETRAELSLHAERLARLERMRRLAERDDRGKLVIRIEILIDRENDRHERRMDALKASFGAK